MQFTAYLRGFVNIQDPRHLKQASFFPSKCLLFLFTIEDGKFEKTGAKNPAKKIGCWHNCLWFSIVFSLFLLWLSIGFSMVLIGFS